MDQSQVTLPLGNFQATINFSHRPISLNVQTNNFARRISHSVWGWTGKDNAKTKPLFPTDSKMVAEW